MMVLRVRDLDRLIRYLIDLGYTVSEGPHAVLPDDSELGYWVLTKGSQVVGEVIAHYVDNHYYALMKAPGASDRDILRALLEAEYGRRWRAPVEEVVAIVASEELRAALEAYSDEAPTAEAEKAVKHYESRGTKIIGRLVARIRGELSLKQG